MSQNVNDIISRVAYEIGDELYQVIKKPEMIKALDRVYRMYCQQTLIKTGTIGFKGTGTDNEFDLFGPIDLGGFFGDNFFSLYRVEFNKHRMEERDFEWIMDARHRHSHPDLDGNRNRHHYLYAIKYLNKYQRMYFAFIPALGDEIILWYYEYPRLGTINNLAQVFPIDDKNTDDLIIGLTVWGWKRMKMHYLQEMQRSPANEQGQKDASMVQFASAELKASMEEWKLILLERKREFASYREEITPTVLQVGEPFNPEVDPNWEQDFEGFEL